MQSLSLFSKPVLSAVISGYILSLTDYWFAVKLVKAGQWFSNSQKQAETGPASGTDWETKSMHRGWLEL